MSRPAQPGGQGQREAIRGHVDIQNKVMTSGTEAEKQIALCADHLPHTLSHSTPIPTHRVSLLLQQPGCKHRG